MCDRETISYSDNESQRHEMVMSHELSRDRDTLLSIDGLIHAIRHIETKHNFCTLGPCPRHIINDLHSTFSFDGTMINSTITFECVLTVGSVV